MADSTWKCYAFGPYVVTEWSGQIARKLCKPKNVGRANETTAEEQAIKEAAAKVAKRAKKENRAIKPMLAQPFSEKKAVWPCLVQPKLDGVRCIAYWEKRHGKEYVVLQSRGGDPYPVKHVIKALESFLPKSTILDGELYIHGMSLQQITSLVKRWQEGSEGVQYVVYDTVDTEEQFRDRQNEARGLIMRERPDHIKILETSTCACAADLLAFEQTFLEEGYEGVIVRDPNATYQPGKRFRGLMKLKRWVDDEFEIVGWKMGEGKYEGVPILRCKNVAGDEFDCNPPGDMAARNALGEDPDALIGQMLTVKFFDYTDAGLPHYPVGVAIRPEGT